MLEDVEVMDATAKPAGDSMRSDARRNYDQLIAAARAIFTEQGTDASLREVARHAGVGIGTLYRHFPTREALLEALLGQGFEALRAEAAELLDAPDPGNALATWLRRLGIASTRYEGLPASVMEALHDPGSRLHASCEGLRTAATDLLARAQRAGQVRRDLNAGELLAIANAMAWAARQAFGSADLTDRYLTLMMEGLLARDGAATAASGTRGHFRG
ncbi:TetR/AcrR family transcriptional regulator [Dactylosporangium fulvum]|uniref:TetR/AcrR family transcriptional regulator n=1 Tax=Dactylosporangium fulvum TaxID=53359 RepID=A0ABY5WCK5_9ACTN|nr:TetR/AcrR family transcriptional regulator [Dactylosporangium fulvum]UWP86774.1 TetR/AcrR family transcriptional regulator [Dactylosporangium fulvum]